MIHTPGTGADGTIIQVTLDLCAAAQKAALLALSAQAPILGLSPAALEQAKKETLEYYAAIANHLPPARN